nr:MAG TPA: hypothetical protein [Caudoviricetes sp.]DAR84061.1 MAG TPA: hypothetical protein [Caudoviricetes sp.]DAX27045.1 MAG TPA: hypothetical protein [Caudoviricetes sp.]
MREQRGKCSKLQNSIRLERQMYQTASNDNIDPTI